MRNQSFWIRTKSNEVAKFYNYPKAINEDIFLIEQYVLLFFSYLPNNCVGQCLFFIY